MHYYSHESKRRFLKFTIRSWIQHFIPLKYGMKTIRRVHFDPFVLTFTLNEDKHHVEFLDFAHHDEIYL